MSNVASFGMGSFATTAATGGLGAAVGGGGGGPPPPPPAPKPQLVYGPLNPNVGDFRGIIYSAGPTKLNLTDRSIAHLGSGSAVLVENNPGRNFLRITNPGGTPIGVNLAAGDAAIGIAGTVTLDTNASIVFQRNFIPTNIVTVVGSSGAPVTCIEG